MRKRRGLEEDEDEEYAASLVVQGDLARCQGSTDARYSGAKTSSKREERVVRRVAGWSKREEI